MEEEKKKRNPQPESKGRPFKKIDWDEFEKLCAIQCTQSEIASWFGVHHDTMQKRVELEYQDSYTAIYKRFSETGKSSLRRTQYKLAQKSAAMAIFLGKQRMWLGQSDVPPDQIFSEETLKPFISIMNQLSNFQSARNIEDNNINNEQKSA
jgi:hypothetical protein